MPSSLLRTEGENPLMSLLTPNFNSTQYRAKWPKSTHWHKASCREVNCPKYLNGWVTKLDPNFHAEQEYFIRHDRERHHTMKAIDGLHHYYFEAGQRCFGGDHYKKLERGPMLLRNRTVLEAEQWINEFNEESHRNNIGR